LLLLVISLLGLSIGFEGIELGRVGVILFFETSLFCFFICAKSTSLIELSFKFIISCLECIVISGESIKFCLLSDELSSGSLLFGIGESLGGCLKDILLSGKFCTKAINEFLSLSDETVCFFEDILSFLSSGSSHFSVCYWLSLILSVSFHGSNGLLLPFSLGLSFLQ
jgi:hypothetical protein